MWRSFFFAIGIFLIFTGLQCLVVEEFRVDKNSRIFAVAEKANRALENSPQGQVSANPVAQYGQGPNLANQQRFSLPSSESYYGGPSRFQNSNYQSSYGGGASINQQSLPVTQVSNAVNPNRIGIGNSRIKALRSYPVKDWMPWGFLAAGTIVSLYTKSTGHSRYSDE